MPAACKEPRLFQHHHSECTLPWKKWLHVLLEGKNTQTSSHCQVCWQPSSDAQAGWSAATRLSSILISLQAASPEGTVGHHREGCKRKRPQLSQVKASSKEMSCHPAHIRSHPSWTLFNRCSAGQQNELTFLLQSTAEGDGLKNLCGDQ